MINFAIKHVNIIYFICAVIVLLTINFFLPNDNLKIIQYNFIENIKPIIQTKENIEEDIWQIKIPKIKLVAPIKQGTTKEIMDKYVGHFTNTSILTGNVGLIAHNRGYPVNYFSKIKELKYQDEIIYQIKDKIKTYYIETITIIKDTNWTYLKDTKDNFITLITCVENQPEYRRCIQAREK